MTYSLQKDQTQCALRHVERKKQKAIDYLGGKCTTCGGSDRLEFDHINPETKSFNIASNLSRSWKTLIVELDKCQLLCEDHHKLKTFGFVRAPDHGITRYKSKKNPCRCEVCKEAGRTYRANLHKSLMRVRLELGPSLVS